VPRDVTVFLEDILEACGKIGRYTSELSLEQFRQDEKTIDAVVRNLEIIGEAAKKLPENTRTEIAVDWKRIAGLRDVLIHDYFGIDVEIIWDIVQTKVPDLFREVSSCLSKDR
jgi:uncharacterized protein with HEPN domain